MIPDLQRANGESTRDAVLARASALLAQGKSPQEALEFLAHTLTNKLLHAPSAGLRQAALQGDRDLLHAAARLFHAEIKPGDKVVLIAPYAAVGEAMARTFPAVDFHWHVPPQGVLDDKAALRACVDFAARCRPDYVFIAIGSPQSELIAHELSKIPGATGVGICCGASLEFIVGLKQRAPMLMQRLGLEWLHRLLSDPRRLWRRYVFAFGPLLGLTLQEAVRRVMGRPDRSAEAPTS